MIATYNAEAFVGRAIRSAQSQVSVVVEIIVVDDCSKDRTLDIVRKIKREDARIRIEKLTQNRGPAAARNRGFASARGRWIAVLDSDDFLAPDRISKLIKVAEEVGADIVSDNLVEFTENDVTSAAPYLPSAKAGWLTPCTYLLESRLFGGRRDYGYLKPVFRAESLRVKRLSYDERLRIAEDDDLNVRSLLAGLRYWLEPQETYFYQKHAASTSHRLSVANARSMCDASAEVIASHQASPELPLLKKRHSALKRGLGFVCLIDSLKRERWLTALGIVVKDPTVLPLLTLPLGAAARRLLPARFSRPKARVSTSQAAQRALSLGIEP